MGTLFAEMQAVETDSLEGSLGSVDLGLVIRGLVHAKKRKCLVRRPGLWSAPTLILSSKSSPVSSIQEVIS